MRKLRQWWLSLATIPLWLFSIAGMANFGAATEDFVVVLIPGTALFAICYGVSLATTFPFVGLTPAALVIHNPLRRLEIPWNAITEVSSVNGLGVKVKGLPEKVYCAAFQGSVVGRVLGHPSARRAARRINDYRVGREGSGAVSENFLWRSHAWRIGVGWALFAFIVPSISRTIF